MFSHMEIDTKSFLPMLIEYGSERNKTLWHLEVDKYIEMNGAAYPERGSFIHYVGSKVKTIIYFILDPDTASINIPLEDYLLTVQCEPGTFVQDELLGGSYIIE